jgi:hypothetical protein
MFGRDWGGETVAEAADDGWAGLPDAIEALRRDLAAAWWDGQGDRVRFRAEPVELTLQVGVTRSGEGSAGIKWHVLTLGGSRKRETTATQTLVLRLQPVFVDGQGQPLSDEDQLIKDKNTHPRGVASGEPGQSRGQRPPHEPV